jgi:hypothetical protein
VSALGYVIKLTSVLDDFGDAACLRFLQRQGFRGPQMHVGPAGNKKGREFLHVFIDSFASGPYARRRWRSASSAGWWHGCS